MSGTVNPGAQATTFRFQSDVETSQFCQSNGALGTPAPNPALSTPSFRGLQFAVVDRHHVDARTLRRHRVAGPRELDLLDAVRREDRDPLPVQPAGHALSASPRLPSPIG